MVLYSTLSPPSPPSSPSPGKVLQYDAAYEPRHQYKRVIGFSTPPKDGRDTHHHIASKRPTRAAARPPAPPTQPSGLSLILIPACSTTS